MRVTKPLLQTLAAASFALLTLTACTDAQRGTEPRSAAPESESARAARPTQESHVAETADEHSASTPAAQPQQGAKPDDDAEHADDETKKQARKEREQQRKLVKLERDVKVAQLKLSKANDTLQQAEINFSESVEKAATDLEIARIKLTNFREISVPNRIARAQLNLERTEDGVTAAREEMQQLELMYNEEQFADKTKEIVLDRARRRLERSERDLTLRHEEFKTLVDVTIPLETREREIGVQQKELALAKIQRDHKISRIGQQIGIVTAEGEIVRLENQREDLLEEIEETQQKKAEEQAAHTDPAAHTD